MACSHGVSIWVTVSPTFTSVAVLMPEMIYPTSPVDSCEEGIMSIFNTPTSSAVYSMPVCTNFTLSPFLITPFSTLQSVMIPRKELKMESKMRACSGAFTSPFGAGMCLTMASSISGTPSPVFPLARMMSSGSHPMRSTISSSTSSGMALGMSILLMTGMISRLWSMAI